MFRKITFLIVIFIFLITGLHFVSSQIMISSPVPLGGFSIGVLKGSSIRTSFDLNPEKLINFRGKLFYEGANLSSIPGKPQVPIFTRRIEIPFGMMPIDVKVINLEHQRLIMPKLEQYSPKTWSIVKKTSPDTLQNGLFPGVLGDFWIEKSNDQTFVTIEVNSVILDFDTDKMNIFTKIVLGIEMVEHSSIKKTIEPGEKPKSVILCPQAFKSAADKLAKAQCDDGYDSEVIFVETIKSSIEPQEEESDFPGPKNFSTKDKDKLKNYNYDLAKRIRNYFSSRINQVSYITIIGDGSNVPASFYLIDRWSYIDYDKYVPSDIYYSSPDLDTVPDIALGRLPVRDVDEANRVVDKIITYRKELKPEKFFNVSLQGGDPFEGGYEGEIDCQALIESGILDGFKIRKFYKTRGKFDTASVLDSFKTETGIISSVSHGSGDAIYTEPGKVTTADILKLPKRPNLPILLTPSCTNGMWDAEVIGYKFDQFPEGDGLSFGQACMLSPGGPVAYFGGSRINYAGINWTIEGGVVKIMPFEETDRILQEVLNAYHNWAGTLGEMTLQAFKKYVGVTPRGYFSTPKTMFAFCFFGDPTIKVPKSPEGAPHRLPDIEFVGCPMTTGRLNIPILSIVDNNILKAKTDVASITLRIHDMERAGQQVEEKVLKPSTDRMFSTQIAHKQKNFWQIRLELPNMSEVWIYYISRAQHDLVAKSSRAFFITKPGKKERFKFNIQNDGVKDVSEFDVEFMFDDKVAGIRKFKELKHGYGQEVTFTLKDVKDGEHKISFRINLDKEQFPEDNTFEHNFIVTSKETAKTAVLVNYYFPTDKAIKMFDFNGYAKLASKFGNIPTEIIPIGDDSYESLIFGIGAPNLIGIGADAVILATPDFGNPFSTSLLSNIRDFKSLGGLVLGFGCTNSALNGKIYPSIAELFGLKGDIEYELGETKDPKLFVKVKDHPVFEGIGEALTLKAENVNLPKNNSWDKVLDKGEIIASSSDGKDVVITTSKTIFCSTIPEITSELHHHFLYNCLVYNLRPQPDVGLSPSDLVCDPAVPKTGESIAVKVNVWNYGNIDLRDIKVVLKPGDVMKVVESLPKGKSIEVTYPLTAPLNDGLMKILARIELAGDIDNSNNESGLRIRVMKPIKENTEELLSSLSIKNGDIFPEKPVFLNGKAPASSVIISGSQVARANDGGNFSLYINPTKSIPLNIKIKTPDGRIGNKDIFCAFIARKDVGSVIGKKYIMSGNDYYGDLLKPPAIIKDKEVYINLTVVSKFIGMESKVDGEKWSMVFDSCSFIGKFGSDIVMLKISTYTSEFKLTKPVLKEGDDIMLPLLSLKTLKFDIGFEKKAPSFTLSFPSIPTDSDPQLLFANKPEDVLPTEVSVPSEFDYSEPSLISYGPTNGQVSKLYEFSSYKNALYLVTTRGIEKWTSEGEFKEVLGLPKTLPDDFGTSWYSVFNSSNKNSSLEFHITKSGNFLFKRGYLVCFYDTKFNLIKKLDFSEEGIYSFGFEHDSQDNLYFADKNGAIHKYKEDGTEIESFDIIVEEERYVDKLSGLIVFPDGKMWVIEDGDLDFVGYTRKWMIHVFDSNGKYVQTRVAGDKTSNEDGENENESDLTLDKLPAPDFLLVIDENRVWAVYLQYNEVSIIPIDKLFNIGKPILLEMMYYEIYNIKKSDEGSLFVTATFKANNNNVEKIYKMVKINEKFEVTPMIPSVAPDNNHFIDAYRMTFDESGNLVVITYDERILRYDRLGAYIGELKFKTKEGDRLSAPYVIHFVNGKIVGLYSDWEYAALIYADLEGNIEQMIPLVSEENALNIINVIPDLENDELYLLEKNGLIIVIPSYMGVDKNPKEIKILRKFGTFGFGLGKMSDPWYIGKFEDRIYTLDFSENKILCFKTSGEFLFEFGGSGNVSGKFKGPSGMFVDSSGLVWVCDYQLNNIQIFDSEGAYLNTLGHNNIQPMDGTPAGYKSDPFGFYTLWEMGLKDGQLALFDYGHERILLYNSLEMTTNLFIIPSNPVLERFVTQTKSKTSFVIANTGPGDIEVALSCSDERVNFEPKEFKRNLQNISVSLDLSKGDIPEEIEIVIESNVGKIVINIPIITEPLNFLILPGEPVATNAKRIFIFAKTPEKTNAGVIVSTKDLEDIVPIKSIASNDNQTVYFAFGDRKLGFKVGEDKASLRIGEDDFTIALDYKVTRLQDGGFTVPLEVMASFLNCQVIKKDLTYRVLSR